MEELIKLKGLILSFTKLIGYNHFDFLVRPDVKPNFSYFTVRIYVCFFSPPFSVEKEAEKAKERLAQEEAEAMEMEDKENKMENTNNEKEVSD